jgi:hypothetical protein
MALDLYRRFGQTRRSTCPEIRTVVAGLGSVPSPPAGGLERRALRGAPFPNLRPELVGRIPVTFSLMARRP